MRFTNWIMAVCFFTASFDIFLAIRIGGTFRLAQLALVVACILAMARVIQEGRILWPRGGTALAIWMGSQILFLPVEGHLSLGIQFIGLLGLTILGFFAVIQLYAKSVWAEYLVKLFLWSYVFVGMFGLIQFILPIVGGPGILVTQWQVHGRFARINGFSYEPSYYATYLVMGWITLIDLRYSKARIIEGNKWKWITLAMTISLFLCSSKTAWVVMILELLARLLPPIWRGTMNTLRRLPQGILLIRIPKQTLVLRLTALFLVLSIGGTIFFRNFNPWMFLQGTGLGGTAAHSYNDRSSATGDTWNVFKEHPYIGRSQGGVAMAIGALKGADIRTMDDIRLNMGFPVLLETLTASGIFAFIPFLWFLWVNTFGALRMSTRYWPLEEAKWLRALARGMVFELLMLAGDQNLIRVYLWTHLTMVSLVAYYLEYVVFPRIGHPEPKFVLNPASGSLEGEAHA